MWSRSLADAILYAVSTAAGFASIYLAAATRQAVPPKDMQGGTAAAFIFLAVFGVLGVSGQLAPLIQQGKLPGMPKGD